jgi:hypothetical protein
MKKIAIGAALLVAGTLLVNAETLTASSSVRGGIKPKPPVSGGDRGMRGSSTRPMGSSTRPMNGSSTDTVGAQIKALNMEMEAKIKAIREEYRVKIQAIIGSTTPRMGDGQDMGSSTGDGHGRGRGDMMGSSTQGRPQGEVEGASTVNVDAQEGSAIGNFFRGLFGR